MKRFILVLFICLLPGVAVVVADSIPTKGFWDDEEISRRSVAPARPEASINGNIVSIYSPDTLYDLEVVIYDNVGGVFWQQTLSLESGDVMDLPVLLEEGEYVIKMSHYWRCLMGEFEVN